jgi:hypothetical protein
MKISDLMTRLNAILAEHGDIPLVVVGDGQCDLLSVHAERGVEVEDDGVVRVEAVAACLDVTG